MSSKFASFFHACIFATVLASSSSSSSSSSSREQNEEDLYDLRQVHLVFRHGDRTPDSPTYPFDPYLNFTFPPYGLGQLTVAGYNRIFDNGKFFRRSYDKFLGSTYNQTEIYAQSTGYPRTIMSMQLFMTGLFPPKNTKLDWNHNLNFQPVVFTSQPLNNDPLLFPLGMSCPRLSQEWAKTFAPIFTANKKTLDELSQNSGIIFKSPIDIIQLYYALKSEDEYGLSLPAWTKKFFPDTLSKLSSDTWGYVVANSTPLKRILGGTLLKKMIADWESRIAGTSTKKMFVYSAHDLNVVGILSACNLWDPNWSPTYGITAIFELKQLRKTGVYGVQVFVRNVPDDKPVLLKIPGCQAFCPLEDFKNILSDNLSTAGDCTAV